MTVVDDDTVIAALCIIKYPIEISSYGMSALIPGGNGNGTVAVEKGVAGVYLTCTYAIVYSRAGKIIIRLIDMCSIRYIYLEP